MEKKCYQDVRYSYSDSRRTDSVLIMEQGLSNSVPKIPQSIQPLTRPDLVQAGAVSNGSPLDHSDSIL